MNCSDILLFHGTKSFDVGLLWEPVEFDNSGSGLVFTETGEVDIDQLQWVQRSVIVSGLRDRSWDNDSGGIDGLPDVFSVDSSGNLLDKYGSESVVSEFFIHAKEIDFGHFSLVLLFKMHMNWDTGNESDKFFGLDNSDTQNPVFIVFWRSECPSQECGTVVESEHVIFILNVILSQESVDSIQLFVIIQINFNPFIMFWKLQRSAKNFFNCFDFINRT